MTQLPPPPMPPPPGAYPPAYAGGPAPRRANAWAVVSLVTGLVGCLLVTPLVAIVAGVVGLGKARVQGGRGMAVAGIVLGVLWAVGLVGAGGAIGYGYTKMQATLAATGPRAVTLINRVAAGDTTTDATTGTLGVADLAALAAKAGPLGTCRSVTAGQKAYASTNNRFVVGYHGTATFDRGTVPVVVGLHLDGTDAAGQPRWAFDKLELP